MSEAGKYGERKHETCRFGTLNPGHEVRPFDPDIGPAGPGRPILVPICNWRAPEPSPPALRRVWGGLVEYERDCAVCLAHSPVEAPGTAGTGEG